MPGLVTRLSGSSLGGERGVKTGPWNDRVWLRILHGRSTCVLVAYFLQRGPAGVGEFDFFHGRKSESKQCRVTTDASPTQSPQPVLLNRTAVALCRASTSFFFERL